MRDANEDKDEDEIHVIMDLTLVPDGLTGSRSNEVSSFASKPAMAGLLERFTLVSHGKPINDFDFPYRSGFAPRPGRPSLFPRQTHESGSRPKRQVPLSRRNISICKKFGERWRSRQDDGFRRRFLNIKSWGTARVAVTLPFSRIPWDMGIGDAHFAEDKISPNKLQTKHESEASSDLVRPKRNFDGRRASYKYVGELA